MVDGVLIHYLLHLLAEVAENLLLFFLQILLRILAVALQVTLKGRNLSLQLGFRFVADGIFRLAQLVGFGLHFLLFFLQFLFLGRELGLKFGRCLLPVLGAGARFCISITAIFWVWAHALRLQANASSGAIMNLFLTFKNSFTRKFCLW